MKRATIFSVWFAVAALALGCGGSDTEIELFDTAPLCIDQDLDYWCASADCNDADSSVHPGAPEIPGNEVDDNCNGTVDEPVVDTDTASDTDSTTASDSDSDSSSDTDSDSATSTEP